MAKIRVLSPRVAEKIAAGEVIERPASAVKELVENSLDAGSTEVTVVLEAGGKSLIEVIDNGDGMSADDLALSIERHATSKLQNLDDLEKIRTLGFRGEALPSIAAVSELSIITRERGADSAIELTQDPSSARPRVERVTFGHFLGSPHGTRIRAAGLFSQVPARLKFLKSQGAEVGQVREWLERLALTRPDVGFRLVSDDRTVLNLRAQSESERVAAILADGKDFPVITAQTEDPTALSHSGISVRVRWLQGLSSPQARKLVQVVNRRALRDRMLQQAILAPFRQALLPGQYPAVALFVDIDPSQLDVNVHPSKTEIRFLDSSKIFRAVSGLIEEMISRQGAPAFAAGISAAPVQSAPTWQAPARWSAPEKPAPGFRFDQPPTLFQTPIQAAEPSETENPLSSSGPQPLAGARFVGILFNTYFVYEVAGELAMIDQHAAHERIRYESLRRRFLGDSPRQVQALLVPEVVHFPPETRPELEDRLAWLERIGFEAEVFGDDSLVFRAVPAEWGTDELRSRLKSLVERTLAAENPGKDGALLMDESLFERLASEACHSAIRAGDRLDPAEVQSLAEELFRSEHPWNCPHGRPTFVRVPRARFEEWFQRRV